MRLSLLFISAFKLLCGSSYKVIASLRINYEPLFANVIIHKHLRLKDPF